MYVLSCGVASMRASTRVVICCVQGAQEVFKELPHEFVSPDSLEDVVKNGGTFTFCIIESVDSISRDGPDTPIYVIQNKWPKCSVLTHFQALKLS